MTLAGAYSAGHIAVRVHSNASGMTKGIGTARPQEGLEYGRHVDACHRHGLERYGRSRESRTWQRCACLAAPGPREALAKLSSVPRHEQAKDDRAIRVASLPKLFGKTWADQIGPRREQTHQPAKR